MAERSEEWLRWAEEGIRRNANDALDLSSLVSNHEGRLAAQEARDALEAYPVGANYISASSTSPATLFGGSWVEMERQVACRAARATDVAILGNNSAVVLGMESFTQNSGGFSLSSGQVVIPQNGVYALSSYIRFNASLVAGTGYIAGAEILRSGGPLVMAVNLKPTGPWNSYETTVLTYLEAGRQIFVRGIVSNGSTSSGTCVEAYLDIALVNPQVPAGMYGWRRTA